MQRKIKTKNGFTLAVKPRYPLIGKGNRIILSKFITFILGSILLPTCVYAQAAETKPTKKKKKSVEVKAEEKPSFTEKAIQRADKTADSVAKTIDRAAEKIDVTLAGGKTYTKKKNNSSISVKQLNIFSEGGKQQSSTSFGINLRLPNLEKRWQVRFANYDEQEEQRNQQERRFRTRPLENRPGAALLFFKNLVKFERPFSLV